MQKIRQIGEPVPPTRRLVNYIDKCQEEEAKTGRKVDDAYMLHQGSKPGTGVATTPAGDFVDIQVANPSTESIPFLKDPNSGNPKSKLHAAMRNVKDKIADAAKLACCIPHRSASSDSLEEMPLREGLEALSSANLDKVLQEEANKPGTSTKKKKPSESTPVNFFVTNHLPGKKEEVEEDTIFINKPQK